ncbi:MAG TPA: TIM barrel protein [Chloroflexi bacterium]|nr:TIM barrel protein [Chloroflexota bacterium]
MNISVISYAFHKQMQEGKVDIFGYLETCKYRYGLDTADIWSGMLTSLDEEYLLKIKDALCEHELTLVNLAVDGPHIWEDDPETREAHYRQALDYLKAGEILGARSVRIDAGGGRDDLEFTSEQMDYIVSRFSEYAKRAADNGYMVGPENHWGPEKTPAVMKAICEAVDSPAFGVLLHFDRWSGPDAEKGDEIIAPWVMHTHVTRAIADRLEPKMAMLRDAGYKGCWGVEHAADNYTEVGVLLAQVRDVLERWRTAG